MQRIWHVKW